MSENGKKWLAVAAAVGRPLVGGVFMFSGFSKLVAAPQEFAYIIEAYQILPPDWSMPLALVLPWMELFLGAWVLIGYFRRPSAAILSGMLGVFIIALLKAHFWELDLGSCGCFGNMVHLKPWQASTLDTALLAFGVAIYKDPAGWWTADHWIDPPPPAPAAKKK